LLDNYCKKITKKENYEEKHLQSFMRLGQTLSKKNNSLNLKNFKEISKIVF
jgi:hypothetical protein